MAKVIQKNSLTFAATSPGREIAFKEEAPTEPAQLFAYFYKQDAPNGAQNSIQAKHSGGVSCL